jgi:hypothetical protein
MIEVTLISATEGSRVGRFVSRRRASLEQLGVNKNQFIQGFLRDNMDTIETAIHNPDLVNLINNDSLLNNKDIASIKYSLSTVGYHMLVTFTADDEVNSVTVPTGEVEYNIIDSTFIQDDMPVSTKETASLGSSIVPTIKSAINNLGFYSEDKFKGVNNPLLGLIKQAEDDEKTTGAPSSTIINRIYMILEQLGIQIYAIIGE